MAETRMFHLRRQANLLYRSCIRRSYASEPHIPTHTHEEQVAFLRAADQTTLFETKNHIDAVISQINKISAHITEMPTTIQKNPTIPPYTLGLQRHRVRDAVKAAQAAIARAEHVKEHLTDLQDEPYPDRSQSSTAAWEHEIAGMSREEKEDKLKSIQLEEEAALARLQRDGERLVRNVKEIAAMSRKGGSLDDPAKAPNPFQNDSVKRPVFNSPVAKGPVVKESRAKEADTTVPKPAETTQSKPMPSLLDLQQELEASLKKGG